MHGILILTQLQLARKRGFSAKSFNQSPLYGSNPTKGTLSSSLKDLQQLSTSACVVLHQTTKVIKNT